MSKICNDCPHMPWCWEDSWENGNNYCQRDNEDLTPKKTTSSIGECQHEPTKSTRV